MSDAELEPESIDHFNFWCRATSNFFSRIQTDGDCWIFNGTRSTYGALSVKGRRMPAHHFSYTFFNGEITEGLYVCHKCDVKGCVNPDHLFLGTHQQNVDDFWQKVGQGILEKPLNIGRPRVVPKARATSRGSGLWITPSEPRRKTKI